MSHNTGHARVSQVCSNCRERHLKCDGGPLCSRCKNEGVVCVFKPSRRGMRLSNRPKSIPVQRNSSASNMFLEWSPPQSLQQLPSPLMTPIPHVCPRARSLSVIKIQAPPTSPQSAHLIDLFYSLFFPTHPFTLPREHLAAKLESRDLHYLQVVIEYIGSYYDARSNRSRYRYLSELLLFTQEYAEDIFKVQAFILLAIGLHADGEPDKADNALRQAHDIASLCGMNDAACSAPQSVMMSLEEESSRRTWWTLKSLCYSWPPPRPLSAVSTPLSVGRSSLFETTLPSSNDTKSPSLPPIADPITSRKASPFPYLTGEEFWNFPTILDSTEGENSDLNLDFITDISIRRLYTADNQLCDAMMRGSQWSRAA
jgi:hypothetical protein